MRKKKKSEVDNKALPAKEFQQIVENVKFLLWNTRLIEDVENYVHMWSTILVKRHHLFGSDMKHYFGYYHQKEWRSMFY